MASGLKLRVMKNLNGADLPANGVIANVYALDPEKAHSTQRNIVIPVGFVDYKQVTLDPGKYLVEALMPSGDILSKEATAQADSWTEVDLEAENSAHEWQGVHNLLGHVESDEPYYRTRSFEVFRGLGPQVEVWQIKTPPPQLKYEGPGGHQMWQTLADWIKAGPQTVLNDLQASLTPSSPKEHDSSTELHSFFMDARGLQTQHLPRWYSLISDGKAMRFLSLPIPWFNLKTEEELPVEVLVQHSKDDLTASFSIPDMDLCTALGYMSRGALRAAAQLVDQAEAVDMLFQKFTNPLGAAGGAYILLGTERQTEKERPWYGWVHNLMNFFPWLPDGAIQYAWLFLQQTPTKENRALAREALITAFRRGVPYYTVGLQWMIDGLTLLGEDDEEAQRMLRAVQQISWRSDTSQTFTSIALAR